MRFLLLFVSKVLFGMQITNLRFHAAKGQLMYKAHWHDVTIC